MTTEKAPTPRHVEQFTQRGGAMLSTHEGKPPFRPAGDWVKSSDYVALERESIRLAERLKEAREALKEIACFGEGPQVNSSFDEPGSAQIARDALLRSGEGE